MAQTFPPAARLRQRREFSEAFAVGQKRHGRLMTFVVRGRGDGAARLGVAVGRKLGNSVERNLAKRRIRELFRRSARPDTLDLVILPKRALLQAPFSAAQEEFDGLLEWAIRHVRRASRIQPRPVPPGPDRRL